MPDHHDKIELTLSNAGVRRVISEEAKLIRSGVSTTGTIGPKNLKEHAVVLNLESVGLVLLTGCSHPKIGRFIQAAKKIFPGRSLHASIGGIHVKTEEEGRVVGELFVKEGVKLVSPCHCITKHAKAAIRKEVGDAIYRENGSGTSFTIQ